jgi:hypothetical protein
MARYFTLVEARQLLPVVDRAIRAAVQAKASYDQSEQTLQQLLQRIIMAGGMLVDRYAVESMKTARQSSGERFKTAIEEIQEIGCLVKDLDTGLLDFPTLFRGEEVYLCWRMGETDIEYWHGVHEGFAGRKAIDQFFVENHQGGTPN